MLMRRVWAYLRGLLKINDLSIELNDLEVKLEESKNNFLTIAKDYSCNRNYFKNFAIINADDFYGRNAFVRAAEFLKGNSDNVFSRMVANSFVRKFTDKIVAQQKVAELLEDAKIVPVSGDMAERYDYYGR